MTAPPDRSGPEVDETSKPLTAFDTDLPASLQPSADTLRLAIARRAWLDRFIDRCLTPPPPLTSAEWAELPDEDPRKVGGVCVAAEAYAQGRDNLVADLWQELESRRAAEKAAEDADYVARAEAHRRATAHLTRGPARSFAARRAEQLSALRPRAGDSPGRGGPGDES